MQNFRTLGLIIKKVRNLFNLSDKYGKIIRCGMSCIVDPPDLSSLQAYKNIGCSDAGRMLNLSGQEMTQFAKERQWEVRADRFIFRSETKQQEEGGVPSLELANMAISYAREMEQIV